MVSQFFLDVAACFQGAAERNGLAEADFEFFNFWVQGALN